MKVSFQLQHPHEKNLSENKNAKKTTTRQGESSPISAIPQTSTRLPTSLAEKVNDDEDERYENLFLEENKRKPEKDENMY